MEGYNCTDHVNEIPFFTFLQSLANVATASKEDLALLPGFGPLKVFD